MNDRIPIASNLAATSLAHDPRWQSVQRVLNSPLFVKAPRMRALLSFLMSAKLNGLAASINEYAIGIEVFRRDARDYDTLTDPVVRVQMGRLRERLTQHYATPGAGGGMRIVIPAGTYVPELLPCGAPPPERDMSVGLASLRMLTPDSGAEAFASGVELELALLLFQRFGSACNAHPSHAYSMEVGIRVEPLHARASVRLIDADTRSVVWLRQRDCHGELGIGQQEALALGICDDVQDYLASFRMAPAGRAPGAAAA